MSSSWDCQVFDKLVQGGGVDVGQYGPRCTHVIVDGLTYVMNLCLLLYSCVNYFDICLCVFVFFEFELWCDRMIQCALLPARMAR